MVQSELGLRQRPFDEGCSVNSEVYSVNMQCEYRGVHQNKNLLFFNNKCARISANRVSHTVGHGRAVTP